MTEDEDEPQCYLDYRHGPATKSYTVWSGVTFLLCKRCYDSMKPVESQAKV